MRYLPSRVIMSRVRTLPYSHLGIAHTTTFSSPCIEFMVQAPGRCWLDFSSVLTAPSNIRSAPLLTRSGLPPALIIFNTLLPIRYLLLVLEELLFDL